MKLTKGQAIGLAVVAAGLAGLGGWYFLIYRPAHPKGDKKPPADTPGSDGNNQVFNPPPPPPTSVVKTWGNLKVGDKLFAASDTGVWSDSALSSGKMYGVIKTGEYVGVLKTKGSYSGSVSNFSKCWGNDTGCLGFVPAKSYKVGT